MLNFSGLNVRFGDREKYIGMRCAVFAADRSG